ncbi:MAG TPA: glycoside hydrolase family 28 protein [Chthoniobacter sp.]|jgi:polygalacturonase
MKIRRLQDLPLLALAFAVFFLLPASPSLADGEGPLRIELPAPVIPNREFSIVDFGAKGDGMTMNTDAIRAAIAACAKAGGGRVTIPAGTFLSGPFELASHMALVLQKGAVLQATGKFSDFGLPDPLPATQDEINAYRKKIPPFIAGTDLKDIAILGEGVIDGAGAPWWAKSDVVSMRSVPVANPANPSAPPEKPLYVPRPHLIVLRNCERVHVQGVTLRNSPMFHLVPHHCHHVLIEDVTIVAPANSPNTDGIDPANSSNIVIQRCTIDTGDDNIAIKGGGVGGEPTEKVFIHDCKFLHGHGVSIGSETEAGVHNVEVRHCTFENTGTALRIKSSRTRGGKVSAIRYQDITMKDVEVAITVSLFYDDRQSALKPEEKPVSERTPQIADISFTDIVCDGATRKAGEIVGLPESPIGHLTLTQVRITHAAGAFTMQDVRDFTSQGFDVQTIGPGPGGVARETDECPLIPNAPLRR